MAKVSQKARERYAEKIKEYRQHINLILEKQKKADAKKKAGNMTSFEHLVCANDCLNLVSLYVLMNSLAVSLLGIKNEEFLNEARKAVYRSIIDLEDVVSSYIDAPFSDYEERLSKIASFGDCNRIKFVRKLGFAIDSLQDAYGVNSKWRWSFVELDGRYAVITKNLIDMKTFVKKMDPRVEGYDCRMEHLDLARRLLGSAADGYREKYELSSLRMDDMNLAVSHLSAQRRLYTLTGDSTQAEVIKKRMEIWSAKMEADARKRKANASG